MSHVTTPTEFLITLCVSRLPASHHENYTDPQDTAGEARTNSSVMYSYGPPHMAKQKQDDHLKHTYSSYVRIRDVALKTCQRRWTIGRSGKRGSGISVLAARHDNDDDTFIPMCVRVCILKRILPTMISYWVSRLSFYILMLFTCSVLLHLLQILFGLVLWHINHHRLFNANSTTHTAIWMHYMDAN